jgi:hypothetical protein
MAGYHRDAASTGAERLAAPGGMPVTRLNARPKAASDWSPRRPASSAAVAPSHVGQAGDHRLAAGPEGPGLGRHQPEDPLHPAGAGLVGGLDVEQWGQDADQVAGHGMVEADRAADQGRGRAAAVAEDLVAVAGMLQLQLQDPGAGTPGWLRRMCPLACGTRATSPGCSHLAWSRSTSSRAPPVVTTWNHR